MRHGFALIYAIIVIIALGTIATWSLYTSSRTVRSVADEYQRIQLGLYLDSAAEYTLLWLSESKSRSQNPGHLDLAFEGTYEVNVTVTPLGLSHIRESNGSVLLDISGYVIDAAEPIRQTKRMVVKP